MPRNAPIHDPGDLGAANPWRTAPSCADIREFSSRVFHMPSQMRQAFRSPCATAGRAAAVTPMMGTCGSSCRLNAVMVSENPASLPTVIAGDDIASPTGVSWQRCSNSNCSSSKLSSNCRKVSKSELPHVVSAELPGHRRSHWTTVWVVARFDQRSGRFVERHVG